MSTAPEPDNRPLISRQLLLVGLIAALLVVGFVVIRQSSNTIVLGSTWEENGLLPIEQLSHQPLTRLLNEYVNEHGKVDYARWKQSPDDMMALLDYLQSTSRVNWISGRTPNTRLVDSTLQQGNSESGNSESHEKAFWINAYNALTIHAILKIYPTNSVRRHTNPIGFNIWNHHKLMVASRAYSLAAIESGPLAEFDDPRIHFAIVRGSVSCPDLQTEAFLPEKIEEQLQACTREFLGSDSNLLVEGEHRIHLSPVIKSALADSGDQTTQMRRLAGLVSDPKIAQILNSENIRLSWLRHDWSLNEK